MPCPINKVCKIDVVIINENPLICVRNHLKTCSHSSAGLPPVLGIYQLLYPPAKLGICSGKVLDGALLDELLGTTKMGSNVVHQTEPLIGIQGLVVENSSLETVKDSGYSIMHLPA